MAKFVIAKTLTIRLENYGHGRPDIQMDIPMSYSLWDLVWIIQAYTNYKDTYDWTFRNPHDESKNLSLKNDRGQVENTSFDEFHGVAPYIVCMYGPLEIHLGARGYKKYGKVYPTMYMSFGKFPTEGEFVNNVAISKEDMQRVQKKDELKDLGGKLQEYFKNKYKISDEIVEGSSCDANKLVQK